MERSKITHVALRYKGVIYSLPAPNRHHDVIRHIGETLGIWGVSVPADDQGFLEETGRFLNRSQAIVSAMLFDQLKEGIPIIGDRLYSENLW